VFAGSRPPRSEKGPYGLSDDRNPDEADALLVDFETAEKDELQQRAADFDADLPSLSYGHLVGDSTGR
jgi:hypothetical protein